MSTKSYYEITFGDYVFHAIVLQPEKLYKKDKASFFISFGGKRKCIDITVTQTDKYAWITGLSYKSKCATNKKLLKEDNGTIMMVNAAMQFTVNRFKYVKHFLLTDNSHLNCQYGKRIPLFYFYLLKTNQTWYMAKFNATPFQDNKTLYQLQIGNAKLDTTTVKNSSIKEYINKYNHDKKTRSAIMIEFKKDKSIRNFILDLMKHNDCEILAYWFQDFFRNQIYLDTNFDSITWIINPSQQNIQVKDIPEFHFDIKHKSLNVYNKPEFHHTL
jgi:hypothetical protein